MNTEVQVATEGQLAEIEAEAAARRKVLLAGADPTEQMIERLREAVDLQQILTLVPFLSAMFVWEGKPVTLDRHFFFEVAFNTLRPLRTLWKVARQMGKTMTEAMTGVMRPALIPFYKTLFVTPLYEQCRRLSSNYCKPLIENSPFKSHWSGPKIAQNVLQRSFRSEGRIQFTFAFTSVDRARGIFCDEIDIDEIQDFNRTFIPILGECLNNSEYKIFQLAGTPKTNDNTVEVEWRESSQAEWFIPCGCGKWNIPTIEYDLLKMIGKWHPGISPDTPGCVCAGCGRPLRPEGLLEAGGARKKPARWVHRFDDRKEAFCGYHVPQVIAPLHSFKSQNWDILVKKSEGGMGYSEQQFHNEVLAESAGLGMQLISEEELQGAAKLPWPNKPKNYDLAREVNIHKYRYRALGVDWGGGGKEGVSLTAQAVGGLLNDGTIDIIWGRKLLTPLDHNKEAAQTLQAFDAFRCTFLAHDFGGAGDLRETMLRNSRKDIYRKLFRSSYGYGGPRVRPLDKTKSEARQIYRLNRTRCILTVLQAIRRGKVRFFKYDWVSKDERGLISDFVYLTEEKTQTKRGADVYTIGCHAGFSDDFVHAVTYACCALWHATKSWPIKDGVPDITPYEPSHHLVEEAEPDNPDWVEPQG